MLRFERSRAVRWSVAVTLLLGLLAGAPAASADLPPGGLSPSLQVAGGTVSWLPVGVETSYRVAISTAPRGSDDRSTEYLTVPRSAGETQYLRPQLGPNQTVYVGVSADGGVLWSAKEAVVSDRAGGPPHADDSDGDGDGEAEAAQVEPGAEAGSAGEQATAQPPGGEEEAAASTGAEAPQQASRVALTATAASGQIIGTNDGAGWGPEASSRIRAGHITWDRVEIDYSPNAVSSSLAAGFNVLAIANAVNDSTPLSQVEPKAWGARVASELASHPSVKLAEAGNESYLKGGVANPVQYGRMYLYALASMKAQGIHIPLLFNMTGDYPRGSWASPTGWSTDVGGGGWLRDAVNGNPGLAGAILANGISIHPYGAVGENVHDDYGVNAAAADEAVAHAVLGSIPRFYITEFGYDLSRCGSSIGACSPREQASKLRAAYAVFATDPHVAGIWWYQSHDDSTGRFGYMNNNGSVRPAFRALSALAVAAGQ